MQMAKYKCFSLGVRCKLYKYILAPYIQILSFFLHMQVLLKKYLYIQKYFHKT
nr:MAG TPA: hypothetical protein [Caudoviricetes sp.]DAQ99414.1 MAG TPA: hypothetical protein [Caudoviricetes sp.]